MTKSEWAEARLESLKESDPDEYQKLKESGMLLREANAYAEMMSKEQEKLMKLGWNEVEAREWAMS